MKPDNSEVLLTAEDAAKTKRSDFYHVDPRRIFVDKSFNIREDYGDIGRLKQQILEEGVKVCLQGYREKIEGTDDHIYHLVDGFRRMTAVQELIAEGHEIKTVPFIVKDKRSYPPEQRILEMFLLNEGKNLTPLEIATLCVKLTAFGWTPSQIGLKTSFSEQQVLNYISLANAGMQIKNLVKEGKISATLAMDIVRENPGDTEKQLEIINAAQKEAADSGKTKVTLKHIEKVDGSKKAAEKKKNAEALQRVISSLEKKYEIEEADLEKLQKAILKVTSKGKQGKKKKEVAE